MVTTQVSLSPSSIILQQRYFLKIVSVTMCHTLNMYHPQSSCGEANNVADIEIPVRLGLFQLYFHYKRLFYVLVVA